MGMDATASLWYGVTRNAGNFDKLRETVDKAENDSPYEYTVDGINISKIWCSEELDGIGATLAHSWWGDLDPIDLDDLTDKLNKAKAVVNRVLVEHGITDEPKLYLHADFS